MSNATAVSPISPQGLTKTAPHGGTMTPTTMKAMAEGARITQEILTQQAHEAAEHAAHHPTTVHGHPACETCDGRGTMPCPCATCWEDRYDHHGPVACPTCDGTGAEGCIVCGAPSVSYAKDDGAVFSYCRDCLDETDVVEVWTPVRAAS